MVCLDEMGPESAKSFPGQQVVVGQPKEEPQLAQRTQQEIDYGRRGRGYVFGAFRPSPGDAWTETYDRRTTAN